MTPRDRATRQSEKIEEENTTCPKICKHRIGRSLKHHRLGATATRSRYNIEERSDTFRRLVDFEHTCQPLQSNHHFVESLLKFSGQSADSLSSVTFNSRKHGVSIHTNRLLYISNTNTRPVSLVTPVTSAAPLVPSAQLTARRGMLHKPNCFSHYQDIF